MPKPDMYDVAIQDLSDWHRKQAMKAWRRAMGYTWTYYVRRFIRRLWCPHTGRYCSNMCVKQQQWVCDHCDHVKTLGPMPYYNFDDLYSRRWWQILLRRK